jgi:hypothetical protein
VTIFGTTAPTSFISDASVEVGVKFRSDVAGTVTGVRYYKHLTDNTSHTGSLWSSTGTLLATVRSQAVRQWMAGTDVRDSSGDQRQYHLHRSRTHGTTYSATGNAFLNAGVDNAPLHALKNWRGWSQCRLRIRSRNCFSESRLQFDKLLGGRGICSGADKLDQCKRRYAQTTTVGSVFGAALQALVLDGSSNPANGVAVTFTVPASGASATFGALTTVTVNTNASGIAATVIPTANNTVGSYSVTASLAGGASATFNLTNTAGPPQSVIAVAGTPQSTPISTSFGNALQAKVTDAFSNPLSGITVTFTAPASSASAAF